MPRPKRKTDYTRETKREAVQLHMEQHLTCREIADQLGIGQPNLIKAWCRAYRREGEVAFLKPKGRPRTRHTEQGRVAQLEMENALLKKLHTELRTAMLVRRDIGSSNTTEDGFQ